MPRSFRTLGDRVAWENKAKEELFKLEQQAFETDEFYRLTPDVGVKAVDANLSGTAYRLWIYLCSLYRFGGRLEDMPTQGELAARLGVSRQAILRAAADLEEAGLWRFKVDRWKGENLTGHGSEPEVSKKDNRGNKNVTPGNKNVTPGNADVTPGNKNVTPGNADVTPDIYNDRARAETYLDYSDFIDSLSEDERESFEKFVRVEWKKLKGEEIVSLERFLSKKEDFDNWHEKFLNSPAGRAAKKEAIATQFDWRNDPRFDEWIKKAFNGGYLWTQEDEAEREQRYAFYEWAQNTNAYEGVCY